MGHKIIRKEKNDSTSLHPPTTTQDDLYLSLKIEKTLALFDNDAWSPEHPQHKNLDKFVYGMARRLVHDVPDLRLPLCQSLVEDAIARLDDRSGAELELFDMYMELMIEQLSGDLDVLLDCIKR